MKKNRLVQTLFSCLLLLAMISCNKGPDELLNDETSQDLASVSVEELVVLVNARYLAEEVTIGEGGLTFDVRNDALIDEYTANEQAFITVDKQADNRFLACLRSTEPGREQMVIIRRVLQAYETRNERVILSHRMAFRQLHIQMDSQRQALNRRYQAGYIDQETFRTRMQELRLRYQESLATIKARNAAAFSQSFEQLLRQLRTILTEEQWAVFSECVAG